MVNRLKRALVICLLCIVILAFLLGASRGLLDDNLAWRVAYRNGRRLTAREVHDGNIVRALVGHVSLFAVAGRGRSEKKLAS